MSLVCYKVSILLLLISFVYCDKVIPQNPIDSQLLLLLKKWRSGHSDSAIIPLPSLKSVKIPDVNYFYDGKGIKMTYDLRKMDLTGLDSFQIKELVALQSKKALEISLSLYIPKLTLYADKYEIKGRAYYLYPLKGSGNMTVIFRENDLTLKIRFITTENGISTRVGDFVFDYNIKQIEANLKDASWPINQVLNSDGVEILAGYRDDIVKVMWDFTVPYLDNHLGNVTITKIVERLLNANL